MPTNKWWVYQRERFPVIAHGALIAAFSLSAVCFSALLRGAAAFPPGRTLLVAFVSSFIFFSQLRIADEFKDYDDDARWRPYRPVPRGLVTLRELGILFALGALIQLALALWLDPRLLPVLGVTWLYLALMSKEFFARDWLKARPVVYMLSHMLIMPLIDFYVMACDWLPVAGRPRPSLGWFLAVSFLNGLIIEIGRKIRAPEDEEQGVETYSFLWGRGRAIAAWRMMVVLTALFALMASWAIGFWRWDAGLLALLVIAAWVVSGIFLKSPVRGKGKLIENYSGLWTLLMYLSLGVIPMFWKLFTAALKP